MKFSIKAESRPPILARTLEKNSVKLTFARLLPLRKDSNVTPDFRRETFLDRFAETCKNPLRNSIPFSGGGATFINSGCGVIIEVPDNPPSDGCNSNDPCSCFNCPEPPISRSCSCTDGYPDASTTDYGSGYWVGLQANSYYSVVDDGGWVVAVGCGSGSVVGAFPVSSGNFGYGVATIAGTSVMVYPAGAVYGAGIVPQNGTTFPLLGLTTGEGDSLLESPNILTSGSLGCPAGANSDYFCSPDNSNVYSGTVEPCMSKFNTGDTDTGCPEYDNYQVWGDATNGDEYVVNLNGLVEGELETISGSEEGYNGSYAIVSFSNESGSYCGVLSGATKTQSDALSGACSNNAYPDQPVATYNDCQSCGEPVPCQFVSNLTLGSFSEPGYPGTFAAIGPANPPTASDGSLENTEFWSNFWGWDDQDTTSYNDLQAVIPPIGALENNCACSEGERHTSDVVFVESFTSCDCDTNPITFCPTNLGAFHVTLPGATSCGVGCYNKCVNPNCSCDGASSSNLGQPSIYGYIYCAHCTCDGSTIAPPDNFISSIWWASASESDVTEVIYDPTTVESPGNADSCISSPCNTLLSAASRKCESPCARIYTSEGVLDPDLFTECTGYDSPQELLDDPCGRLYYLPSGVFDCELTYQDEPIDPNPTYANTFSNHILVDSECSDCANNLMNCSEMCDGDPANSSCYLSYIASPFGSYDCEDQNGGGIPTAITPCVVPDYDTSIEYDPESSCFEVCEPKLIFKRIGNERCVDASSGEPLSAQDERIANPCGCCGTTVSFGSPDVGCSDGTSPDGEGCKADCCQGSGCATGACLPPLSVEIRDCNGSSGGDPGGDGGSGGSGGSGGGGLGGG